MMLFVTILEQTPAATVDAIRGLKLDHDGVEVRVEKFASYDARALRAATPKTMMLTRRGGTMPEREIDAAIAAGIEWVDVEHGRALPPRHRDRIVLSHHDYEGMPDVERLAQEMRATGCAQVKIAVTPRTLADNLRLLDLLESGRLARSSRAFRPAAIGRRAGRPATAGETPALLSVIGMGERGLYSRILAPFVGSAFAFSGNAAPGQLPLEDALDIYGERRGELHAEKVFAVAGNPAGHSQSPLIHNHLFREKRVPGAYTIASVERFDEVASALESGRLAGVSVTAPFKEDALRFAEASGFEIAPNAREARAVNTLVGRLADNTDVDGFEMILRQVCGRDRKSAAVLGAGGTSRAAQVALSRLGVTAQLFHRATLPDVRSFDGEIVINTLPAGVEVDLPLRPGMSYIEAAYGGPRRNLAGVDYHDGLELLHAQAVRQHELFMRVFDAAR